MPAPADWFTHTHVWYRGSGAITDSIPNRIQVRRFVAAGASVMRLPDGLSTDLILVCMLIARGWKAHCQIDRDLLLLTWWQSFVNVRLFIVSCAVNSIRFQSNNASFTQIYHHFEFVIPPYKYGNSFVIVWTIDCIMYYNKNRILMRANKICINNRHYAVPYNQLLSYKLDNLLREKWG